MSAVPNRAQQVQLALHPGQRAAWAARKRFVLVLAGAQSGKTVLGPPWLYREIQWRGPGDYLVVTPTFPLLELKALPEFRRYFEQTLHLGRYTSSPSRRFIFSGSGEMRIFGYRADIATQVIFGYAQEPEALESLTAKAAWLDEAGQRRFRQASFEAVQRRLALAEGRILLTTTPYNLGWLKRILYDPWVEAGQNHPEIDVIQFDSLTNPAFPRAEYARAERDLPTWKFDLFYRGVFTRPAGLIFDCFDAERHVCPAFAIPHHWARYWGLDFGGVHTACLYFAEDPRTQMLYLYREYLAGSRTAADHVGAMLRGELMHPDVIVGGTNAEAQWRAEFSAAGLPVRGAAIHNVEVGLDRVYGALKRDELRVFETCTGTLEQFASYSRQLDEAGEPTELIADKHSFHFMDACRYCVSFLKPGVGEQDELIAALADFVG